MEQIEAARLAELPTTQWEQAKERVAVVRRYLRQGDTSMHAVTRHAHEIGLGRGMFYRLVKVVKAWDECKEPVRPKAPRRPTDVASALLAREAVDLAGPAATLEQAIARAVELATDRGTIPPSERAIRGAYGRVRSGRATRERLKLPGRFAIDATALEATVADGHAPAIAVLTAVVDMRDGMLVAWRLSAGEADAATLSQLIDVSLPDLLATRAITVSSALPDGIGPLLARGSIEIAERRTAGGSILKAVLGSKIGRIRILPRYLSRGSDVKPPVVQFDDLHAVITEIFAAEGIAIGGDGT
ncbi:hypothetical protein [Sphingomonas sp. NFX23]|uniref:hypothetical protein n=1 Tax=Sphingomonas sp. NFX23 TaxID=2819532 RepID=UPI003CFA7C47